MVYYNPRWPLQSRREFILGLGLSHNAETEQTGLVTSDCFNYCKWH